MVTKIFCWNFQGVGHPKFHNFMSEYKRDFSTDLVCLLETRINDTRADGVIAKMRFPNSFRAEVNGFIGSIWLCWTDNIIADVLEVHFQVVHVRISNV